MARAAIPYDALEKKIEQMFPRPCFAYVQLLGKTRKRAAYEEKPTPTTIYDRRSGNYKVIGYRCKIRMERLSGMDDNFYPDFENIEDWFLIELE